MKRVSIDFILSDVFAIVAGISEDNDLHTVDDLCNYLEQNGERVHSITKYTRGESNA